MRRPRLALAPAILLAMVGGSVGCNAILGNGYGVDVNAANDPDGSNGGGDALVDGGGGGDGSTGVDATVLDEASLLDRNDPDGSGCLNGVCPTMLASVVGPQRLALNATGVYWASAAGIGRVVYDGSNTKTFPIAQAVGSGLKRGIAVDATSVYVTMPGGGKGAAKCAADLTSCAAGFIGSAGIASSIAVDATHVYVGIFDDGTGSGLGGMWQTSLTGTALLSYANGQVVRDIQVVGTTTYFRTSTAVNAVTAGGGPAVPAANLASGEAPLGFVVAGATLVVATTNNHLQACPIAPAPCAATVVQSRPAAPSVLTADATHAYWLEGNGGTVNRCDLPGCTNAVTLADGQASPSDIVVDGTSVYWANFGNAVGGGGAVMKLPK